MVVQDRSDFADSAVLVSDTLDIMNCPFIYDIKIVDLTF